MNKERVSMLDFVEFLSSPSDTDEEPEEKDEALKTNAVTEDKVVEENHLDKISWKKNLEKKNEALARIQQFNTHILAIEKENKSRLYHKNAKEFLDLKELQNIENNFGSERKKELKQLNDNLQNISLNIEKFKHEKNNMKKHPSFIEKLKILMEDIERSIMQFKEQQKLKYEDLLAEEKNLTSDIEMYDQKFRQWSKVKLKIETMPKHFEKNNKEANLPKEVEDFEQFLELTGGHQGGWDDIDHQTFLKLRRNIKDNNNLLKAAIGDIPTQSHVDIIQHIEWYVEYCILRENKREAIRKWKVLKDNEKAEFLSNLETDKDIDESKRRKKEEVFAKEQLERFEKLQDWKVQKKKMEEQKMENKQSEEEKQKIKTAVAERKRWEQLLKVEEYKRKKQEEEAILNLAKQEKFKKTKLFVSAEEKERIKERNEKIAIAKQNILLKKQYEDAEKEERLSKLKSTVTVTAERNPARLHQMTEGWKIRKQAEPDTKIHKAQGARLMPHRAVPTWRQGLH